MPFFLYNVLKSQLNNILFEFKKSTPTTHQKKKNHKWFRIMNDGEKKDELCENDKQLIITCLVK